MYYRRYVLTLVLQDVPDAIQKLSRYMDDGLCFGHMLTKLIECHYQRRVFTGSDPSAFNQYAP